MKAHDRLDHVRFAGWTAISELESREVDGARIVKRGVQPLSWADVNVVLREHHQRRKDHSTTDDPK